MSFVAGLYAVVNLPKEPPKATKARVGSPEDPLSQQIFSYIKENPGCTRKEIASQFNLEATYVSSVIIRARSRNPRMAPISKRGSEVSYSYPA